MSGGRKSTFSIHEYQLKNIFRVTIITVIKKVGRACYCLPFHLCKILIHGWSKLNVINPALCKIRENFLSMCVSERALQMACVSRRMRDTRGSVPSLHTERKLECMLLFGRIQIFQRRTCTGLYLPRIGITIILFYQGCGKSFLG